jgi:hypothetical protein
MKLCWRSCLLTGRDEALAEGPEGVPGPSKIVELGLGP